MMKTQGLTPKQVELLEKYKKDGVSSPMLERVAKRFACKNINTCVIKGYNPEKPRTVIRGTEGGYRNED